MSREVGSWLTNLISTIEPDTHIDAVLDLEIDCNDALVQICTQTLYFMWQKRLIGKVAKFEDLKATIDDKLRILDDTKHFSLSEMITLYMSI